MTPVACTRIESVALYRRAGQFSLHWYRSYRLQIPQLCGLQFFPVQKHASIGILCAAAVCQSRGTGAWRKWRAWLYTCRGTKQYE